MASKDEQSKAILRARRQRIEEAAEPAKVRFVPRYNNKLGPKNIVEPPPKEDDASENMSLGAGSGTSAIRMRRNDKAKKKAQHEMMMSLLRPLRKLAVNAPELDLDSLGQLKPQQYDSDESEAEVTSALGWPQCLPPPKDVATIATVDITAAVDTTATTNTATTTTAATTTAAAADTATAAAAARSRRTTLRTIFRTP